MIQKPKSCPHCETPYPPSEFDEMPNRQQEGNEHLKYVCGLCHTAWYSDDEIGSLENAQIEDLKDKADTAYSNGEWSGLSDEELSKLAASVIVTSAFNVANREIEKEIEFITAECAYGMNIFRDLFAGLRDIVGGRSGATQKVLRDARKTAIAELRNEAFMLGADAVIGTDLNYSEFSGGGKNGMLFIVASGTAVKLKK